jgi:glycosyltransferase involved in cell wall biosynthesis
MTGTLGDNVEPRISVVMAVYNGEHYLREAVDSILGQTFQDFEFIIVDDGSTDATPAILGSFTDPRLVRLRNQGNIGLTRSLNRGLAAARGEFIARMDADDVALPRRLEKQVEYLSLHHHVGLLGTDGYFCSRKTGEKRRFSFKASDGWMRWELLFINVLVNPTIMFRKELLKSVGKYDESFRYAQDYELCTRIAKVTKIDTLNEPLFEYYVDDNSQISKKNADEQWNCHCLISTRCIRALLKDDSFPEEMIKKLLAFYSRDSARGILTHSIIYSYGRVLHHFLLSKDALDLTDLDRMKFVQQMWHLIKFFMHNRLDAIDKISAYSHMISIAIKENLPLGWFCLDRICDKLRRFH